jgi:glucose/mannose-6-phosphate isomerase
MGDILEAIRSASRQARDSLALGRRVKLTGQLQAIVYAGMGGSGIPGDLLRALLRDSRTPVLVSKDYRLPGHAGPGTLAIITSYSGDTEETLAAYRDARTSKCRMLALTSGGKLAEQCRMDGTPVIMVPAGQVPRQTLASFLFSLLGCLSQSGIVQLTDGILEQAITALGNAELERRGEELAEQLAGRIPIIYTSQALAGLGLRWKQAMNENGKVPAYANTFTELCHNEVEGYASPLMQHVHAILIRDERDHPGVQKRMAAVKAVLKGRGVPVTEVVLRGDHLLIRLCQAIQLGDYASYFLAKRAGINPYETPVIARIKEQVRKGG